MSCWGKILAIISKNAENKEEYIAEEKPVNNVPEHITEIGKKLKEMSKKLKNTNHKDD